MMGAVVHMAVRDGIAVFRTLNLKETKELIQELVKRTAQESLPRLEDTLVTSKRQKYADPESIWIRMLSCIPTFSERISRAIITHFGTLRELQRALADPRLFPRVVIGKRTTLAKARVSRLVDVLAPPTFG